MHRVEFQAMQREAVQCEAGGLGMNDVKRCSMKMNSVRISISLIFRRYYFKD